MVYQATLGASTGWHLLKRLLVKVWVIDKLLIWSYIHQLGSQGSLLLTARLSRYRERVVSISILSFYELSRNLYLCMVGLRRPLSLLNARHFRDRKALLHPFRNTLHPLSFWLLSLLSWRVAFFNHADTLPSKVRSSRVVLIEFLLILNRDPILMIPDGCVVIVVSSSTFKVDVLRVVIAWATIATSSSCVLRRIPSRFSKCWNGEFGLAAVCRNAHLLVSPEGRPSIGWALSWIVILGQEIKSPGDKYSLKFPVLVRVLDWLPLTLAVLGGLLSDMIVIKRLLALIADFVDSKALLRPPLNGGMGLSPGSISWVVPLPQRGLSIHERLICPQVTLIHDVNVRSLVVKAVRGTVTLENGHVVGEVMMISLVSSSIIRHVSSIVVSVL
jgi:hypothetical protein